VPGEQGARACRLRSSPGLPAGGTVAPATHDAGSVTWKWGSPGAGRAAGRK
jgi:hypothetical protein